MLSSLINCTSWSTASPTERLRTCSICNNDVEKPELIERMSTPLGRSAIININRAQIEGKDETRVIIPKTLVAQNSEYELSSVAEHLGASVRHYIFWWKNEETWIKYNDHIVSEEPTLSESLERTGVLFTYHRKMPSTEDAEQNSGETATNESESGKNRRRVPSRRAKRGLQLSKTRTLQRRYHGSIRTSSSKTKPTSKKRTTQIASSKMTSYNYSPSTPRRKTERNSWRACRSTRRKHQAPHLTRSSPEV